MTRKMQWTNITSGANLSKKLEMFVTFNGSAVVLTSRKTLPGAYSFCVSSIFKINVSSFACVAIKNKIITLLNHLFTDTMESL